MIGIIGAGAFGTALAVSLAKGGRDVRLWGRNESQMSEMQTKRLSVGKLKAVALPSGLVATSNLADLQGATVVLVALPTQSLRGFLAENAQHLNVMPLVACCKGIDLETLEGPTSLLRAACPASEVALLTGPSFAADIARGLPTALTLACENEEVGAVLQQELAVSRLRLYRNTDVGGCELGGALKNVIAIACGACIGQGMGENARAALMTRGFAEMQRLAGRLGAKPETLMGLSGFGDLVLTCTSDHSRNFMYGLALGQGEAFDPTITVEGVATAKAASRLAEKLGVEVPIIHALASVLDGKTRVSDALQTLLARPLKKE